MFIYLFSRATGPTILVTVGITIQWVTSTLLRVLLLLKLLFELSHFLGQIGDLTGLSATWIFPGLLCGIEGINSFTHKGSGGNDKRPPCRFSTVGRTIIPLSINTTPPTNIITMVTRLPPLRHKWDRSPQSNTWVVILRGWLRVLAIGLIWIVKLIVPLIWMCYYLYFWQINRPPSQMVAKTASIVGSKRPNNMNRLTTY